MAEYLPVKQLCHARSWFDSNRLQRLSRGSVTVAYQSHKLVEVGSTPTPASKFRIRVSEICYVN